MRWKSESGQALILVAFSMVVLIGFLGLGVDMGVMRHEKQVLQTVADSAAIAGASELDYSDPAVGAQNAAALNGFVPNGTNGETLTVNNPPKSGPHTNSLQYVEVIATEVSPTYFMKIFNINSVNISARAVGYLGSSTGCIYALNPTSSGAIKGTGSFDIQSQCGIYDNSSSDSALKATGSLTISAKSIGIVGNYNTTGTVTLTPTPQTGMVPVPDPLAYLSPPSVAGSCSSSTKITGSGTYTVNPGTVKITGSPTVTLNPGEYCTLTITGSPNLTFNPGTYILDNGLKLTGSETVNGDGVTFYNASGSITITGSGSSNLSAPTTGPYAGILVYQSASNQSAVTVTGSASMALNGAIYAPKAEVDETGSSSASAYSIVVADTIKFTGSETFNDDYSSLPNGSPIKAATLVE